MGQLKSLLNVPGAGWCLPVGDKGHHMALRRGQIHRGQCVGHGLCGAFFYHTDQISKTGTQRITSFQNVACYSLMYHICFPLARGKINFSLSMNLAGADAPIGPYDKNLQQCDKLQFVRRKIEVPRKRVL
jgi:hypothetical protein